MLKLSAKVGQFFDIRKEFQKKVFGKAFFTLKGLIVKMVFCEKR